MPCLSSSAVIFLNESISVSNAESQVALPFRITAVFGVSVISSPNGSAVCTVGGAAAAGGVGAGVAGAGGAGAAGAGGSGWLAGGVVGGDCAKATEIPAVTIRLAKTVRKQVNRVIRGRSPEGRRHANTRGALSSHDRCVMVAFRVRTQATLLWPIRHPWPYNPAS